MRAPAVTGAVGQGGDPRDPVYAVGGEVFGKEDSTPRTVFGRHGIYVSSMRRQKPLDVIWPPWIGVQGGGLCKVTAVWFYLTGRSIS
jgi:hypothetical protein